MPSLPKLNINLRSINRKLSLGRRSGSDVVGLDIQPGFVGAVQVSVNGSMVANRAACLPLGADVVREGEVVDQAALSEVLRELFAGKGLSKHVRVGVANQRTVMRTLELPPVTERKELAAAVSFQAQDQVPMPLSNAVLDFNPLGIVDTPSGPRQRVVLVAAQLDMVEHLLGAVRGAGLQPVGIDLSAFALIRSLYLPQPEAEEAGRVVYVNVDGLTNLAIADGTVCRFTRVVGGGMEGMAGELAERLGIPVIDARAMLLAVDLRMPVAVERSAVVPKEIASEDAAREGVSPQEAVPEAVVPQDAAREGVSPQEASRVGAPRGRGCRRRAGGGRSRGGLATGGCARGGRAGGGCSRGGLAAGGRARGGRACGGHASGDRGYARPRALPGGSRGPRARHELHRDVLSARARACARGPAGAAGAGRGVRRAEGARKRHS